jgi:hypothetical protein
MIRLVEKSWIWKLTGPFAARNLTTIGHTIYHPKGEDVTPEELAHEMIHVRQQEEVGIVKFLFLYMLCLPLFWNPWRTKWELEAYTKGSGLTAAQAHRLLESWAYGKDDA